MILMTGMSHRTAPLSARESVSFTRDQLPHGLRTLKELVGDAVILSTCNRTEVYTVARDPATTSEAIGRFFESTTEYSNVGNYLYTLEHDSAVRHLFRVASGLDSLIIGESEVLGQVRDAFGVASQYGHTSGAIAHVFHSALRTGKRARSETNIGRNALSTSRACVELARQTIGDLTGRKLLIVGIGQASELAGRAFRDAGVGSITIANRTPSRASDIADSLNARIVGFQDIAESIVHADLVVTATGSPGFIIDVHMLGRPHMRERGQNLLIVDLAMPRDVDPAVSLLSGITLRTMADLEAIAETNLLERRAEAFKAEKIVDEEVSIFSLWWKSRGVVPTIVELRNSAEAIRSNELAKTLSRMKGLSSEDATLLEKMTKSLVKKLLHNPTTTLREKNHESFTRVARDLFSLDS